MKNLSTTEQPFAAYAEAMKLQIAIVTHEVSKMLYYSALDSLPYDSIVQLMNADSSYTFKFTTNQQRDLTLMADDTPQESGNVTYLARALTTNEGNLANYYLNLNELPTTGPSERRIMTEDDIIIDNTSYIKIYPNPSESNLFIDFGNDDALSLHIFIYDITGKEVFNQNIQSTSTIISLSHKLLNGIYLLRINDLNKQNTESFKFIVNH